MCIHIVQVQFPLFSVHHAVEHVCCTLYGGLTIYAPYIVQPSIMYLSIPMGDALLQRKHGLLQLPDPLAHPPFHLLCDGRIPSFNDSCIVFQQLIQLLSRSCSIVGCIGGILLRLLDSNLEFVARCAVQLLNLLDCLINRRRSLGGAGGRRGR